MQVVAGTQVTLGVRDRSLNNVHLCLATSWLVGLSGNHTVFAVHMFVNSPSMILQRVVNIFSVSPVTTSTSL